MSPLAPGRTSSSSSTTLDESDLTKLRGSANPLYLAATLPDGVHLIVTARRDSPALSRLSIQTDRAELEIGSGAQSDQAVRELLRRGRDGR